MQVFICEDMIQFRDDLVRILRELKEENKWSFHISCFSNGRILLDEIVKRIENNEELPEVIISDIEMPEMDGIALGIQLRKYIPECTFILQTAFAQYAVEGYETGAVRYLLKPVQKEQVLSLFKDFFEQKRKEKKVIIKTTDEELCVYIKDIIYFDAQDKYLMLHTVNGSFLIRGSLQEYEDEFKECGFFRIHRKTLINMWHHKSLRSGHVIMSNADSLQISRRNEAEYKKAFMKYMGDKI